MKAEMFDLETLDAQVHARDKAWDAREVIEKELRTRLQGYVGQSVAGPVLNALIGTMAESIASIQDGINERLDP